MELNKAKIAEEPQISTQSILDMFGGGQSVFQPENGEEQEKNVIIDDPDEEMMEAIQGEEWRKQPQLDQIEEVRQSYEEREMSIEKE